MATVEGADGASPVSSAKLSALGKALDQTSISSASGVASPQAGAAPEGESKPAASLAAKSPKKRGRTDSTNRMLPAPASQRHKQVRDALIESPPGGSSAEDEASTSLSPSSRDDTGQLQAARQSLSQPAKLMVKDRKGSGMGVPRAHLILNAVKQAPPAKEKSNPRRWSKHEDESLRLAVERSGERNWKAIADQVPGRNHTQCLQRWTKVLKPGLIKGHWTPEEDAKLRDLVAEGKKNWGQVASLIPGRTSKQCRERWCNHLDPNINKGSYTEDEDKIIVEMQAKLGNRWSIIAQQLKGRTEDAVKIRWKSLMRGRRAATKEDKAPTPTSSATPSVSSSPAAPNPSMASSPASAERPKPKEAKSTPKKSHSPASSSAMTPPNATVKNEVPAVHVDAAMPAAMSSAGISSTVACSSGAMSTGTNVASAGVMKAARPMEQPPVSLAAMGNAQSMNDMVAASIHNFHMSQLSRPTAQQHASHTLYTSNPNQMMQHSMAASGQPHVPVYALPDGNGGFTVNPQQLPPQHLQHQQHQQQQQASFQQFQPGYSVPQSMNMMSNYGVAPNFPTSAQMPLSMAMQAGPMPVQASSAMPQPPMNSSQAMAMAMANAPYQQQQQVMQAPAQGFGGVPLHPRGVAMSAPSEGPMQSFMAGVNSANMPSNSNSGAGTSFGLPPSSAAVLAAGSRGLNTPREEWGSSQTPRSQMILTEGHASAYELFHQQRLRLMLQEREKQGMTLSSAPSPGQALLTKELEANKERQARQAIMQKGWKSAVDAMISFNGDVSSIEDQQRFDGLLEKVSLSALDPTDDELLDQSVDIIAGAEDTVDL